MRTIGFVFLAATVAAASLLAQQPEAKKDAIEKPESGKFVVDSPKQKPRVLDTHVHFFDPLRPTAPPRPKDGKPLPRPVLPTDLKKLAAPHGVVGCLIVEASSILEDNQWWLDLAAADPFIVGVIGRLDPASEDFEKSLRRFAKNPLYRGIRISHNEVKAGLKANLADRLKVMIDLNLALDVNGGPDMPADVAILASKLPKLRIVINHAANLRIDGKAPPAKWREGMEASAKNPNVFCKVSALVEQTGQKQAPRDVKYYRPVLDTLWELFGEDRLIFGSNWPVSNGGAPYETVVGIVQDYFSDKGDKAAAKFFLGNSQTAYAWRPRGAREIKNRLGLRKTLTGHLPGIDDCGDSRLKHLHADERIYLPSWPPHSVLPEGIHGAFSTWLVQFSRQKHVILVYMSGGPSQFETWDPKPGQHTVGPPLRPIFKLPACRATSWGATSSSGPF